MHSFLIEMMECPSCHGALTWLVDRRDGPHIEEGEASCSVCSATFPIRDGIGVFLTPDLAREDLWEQADAGIVHYLQEHPDIERRLLGAPLEELNPADQFLRASALEARGDFGPAQVAATAAHAGLYTPEYRACYESEIANIVGRAESSDAPVVDLASGRGELIERLARKLHAPVVATDFSPRVLRRNRRWFEFLGLYDRVSLLAFDARRSPFREGAIRTLTSNLGLANIREPGDLLGELRRIVAREFLAVACFYPEADTPNAVSIRQAGLETMLYRRALLGLFEQADWQVEINNPCISRVLPTPASALVPGAGIDALPVAETTLEWCMLAAQ